MIAPEAVAFGSHVEWAFGCWRISAGRACTECSGCITPHFFLPCTCTYTLPCCSVCQSVPVPPGPIHRLGIGGRYGWPSIHFGMRCANSMSSNSSGWLKKIADDLSTNTGR